MTRGGLLLGTLAACALVAPLSFFALSSFLPEKTESGGYDDPAVSVCENVILASLPSSIQYRRLGGIVSGSVATVRYQTQLGNTAPSEAERACDFQLNDGHFSLRDIVFGEDYVKCMRRKDETIGSTLARIRDGSSNLESEVAALEDCIDVIEDTSQQAAAALRELFSLSAYFDAGLYPIPIDKTSLRR